MQSVSDSPPLPIDQLMSQGTHSQSTTRTIVRSNGTRSGKALGYVNSVMSQNIQNFWVESAAWFKTYVIVFTACLRGAEDHECADYNVQIFEARFMVRRQRRCQRLRTSVLRETVVAADGRLQRHQRDDDSADVDAVYLAVDGWFGTSLARLGLVTSEATGGSG